MAHTLSLTSDVVPREGRGWLAFATRTIQGVSHPSFPPLSDMSRAERQRLAHQVRTFAKICSVGNALIREMAPTEQGLHEQYKVVFSQYYYFVLQRVQALTAGETAEMWTTMNAEIEAVRSEMSPLCNPSSKWCSLTVFEVVYALLAHTYDADADMLERMKSSDHWPRIEEWLQLKASSDKPGQTCPNTLHPAVVTFDLVEKIVGTSGTKWPRVMVLHLWEKSLRTARIAGELQAHLTEVEGMIEPAKDPEKAPQVEVDDAVAILSAGPMTDSACRALCVRPHEWHTVGGDSFAPKSPCTSCRVFYPNVDLSVAAGPPHRELGGNRDHFYPCPWQCAESSVVSQLHDIQGAASVVDLQ